MAILTSPKVRFTVRQYFRMADAGVFDNRRVELVDGRILQMAPQGLPHATSVSKCNILCSRHFHDLSQFWLLVQTTYRMEKFDAPEPDVCVLKCRTGTGYDKQPTAFLVIEVANKTYKRDSGTKLRRYAAKGIQDYWIVTIPEKRVEVYRKPENPTGKRKDWQYGSIEHFQPGEKIKLLAYPKIQFAVKDMLP
jgi:Uma2 family endonuclease